MALSNQFCNSETTAFHTFGKVVRDDAESLPLALPIDWASGGTWAGMFTTPQESNE